MVEGLAMRHASVKRRASGLRLQPPRRDGIQIDVAGVAQW